MRHPLPEGVNDTPRAIRKRLTSKTHPSYIRLREASPPPKRRKGSFFPGRSRGFQEGDLFPRIGMGWSGVRRLNPRNWFPEAWGLPPVSQSDRREGTLVPLFLIYCMLLCAQHRRALPSTHDNLPSPSSPLTPSPRGISLEPQG